jgi:PEGA domain-containing protein
MSRRVLVVVIAVFVVVLGGAMLWYASSPRPPAPSVNAAAPVAAPPVARSEPAPTPALPPAPVPDRAPATPSRSARRPAAPKDAPAAAEPATPAAMGTLHITSDIAGAQVFIDRNFIGVTPVTSPDVAAGSHRINVVAQGYDSIAESIEVEPGVRDLAFNFKEVRLDASIDVVHKHRIGSCKGRLVASPQGLRYETDDKDDRFTVPLNELEVFEVDYLSKTLKVKGRKGKRFELSDPTAANGDRVFVFHRDVDKARQRLKQGS